MMDTQHGAFAPAFSSPLNAGGNARYGLPPNQTDADMDLL